MSSYPTEVNLGKKCEFWGINERGFGCGFTDKPKLVGRLSCAGVIDEACLHLVEGRPVPLGLSKTQILEINIRRENHAGSFHEPALNQK